MKLSVLYIACIISVFQALLVAAFLITDKKTASASTKIFAAWLFLFAVTLSCNFLVSYEVWKYFVNYHKTIFIVAQLSFLTGPLFYLYIKSLFDQQFILTKKDLIHSVPFFIIIGYIAIAFISIPRFTIWGSFLDFFCNGTFLLQNMVYCILSLRILKLNGITVQSFFSYVGNLQVIWLRVIVSGYIVIWIANLQSFLFWLFSRDGSWCSYTASTYFMSSFILFTTIVFFALKGPGIFIHQKKYRNSILSSVNKSRYKMQLVHYMETEKPYLNMTLNLSDLSRALSIPPRYLSQVINESFHQNFYDFINSYRIRECKKLLMMSTDSRKTILEIAFECGFNTKATFNSVFKRHTGLTPRQFRKNVLEKHDKMMTC